MEIVEDEHQDGRDGSYPECYRKDHRGLSVAQARDHAIDTIASEWKNLNKECFRLYHLSASSFKRASLNLARITPLMYDYDDNQRLPVLEEARQFLRTSTIEAFWQQVIQRSHTSVVVCFGHIVDHALGINSQNCMIGHTVYEPVEKFSIKTSFLNWFVVFWIHRQPLCESKAAGGCLIDACLEK
ncbi:Tricyclene synthase Oc15, chloroplastic [Sesamum angolense]|uniref:Tricyclene synthase Oc15, chloroplastic n=1 Tax=Sesamum angolense TaxID=2727404 RepID=A0AAE1WT42_9LAMI|nr:Tricyclene synthase Oc15, chloroplastic [Sesamum angolense]